LLGLPLTLSSSLLGSGLLEGNCAVASARDASLGMHRCVDRDRRWAGGDGARAGEGLALDGGIVVTRSVTLRKRYLL